MKKENLIHVSMPPEFFDAPKIVSNIDKPMLHFKGPEPKFDGFFVIDINESDLLPAAWIFIKTFEPTYKDTKLNEDIFNIEDILEAIDEDDTLIIEEEVSHAIDHIEVKAKKASASYFRMIPTYNNVQL